MIVHFITPTRISKINLTTIGDSEKREDSSKIGQFSSGMAYATALLLRDNVNLSVAVYGGAEDDKRFVENYSYSTRLRTCDTTGKTKETIDINYLKGYLDKQITETLETGFALQLGYNWELYMALRELWSNMLDEGGYVSTLEDVDVVYGTVISLEFDETNEFYNIWDNQHLYINQLPPSFILDSRTEVLDNPEGYLRIYKQNILVYKDEEVPSKFAWNIKFGQIDERRILSNLYSVEGEIVDAILRTKNEAFLKSVIKESFKLNEKEFLTNRSPYGTASTLLNEIVSGVYEEFGQVESYNWIIDQVKKRKDCSIAGKKIMSVEDSLWNYSTTVTVETEPQPHAEPRLVVEDVEYITPFEVEINKFYNFKLDIEVKRAVLTGNKCVADKYRKCVIIDEKFSVGSDFPEFLVQYLDLTREGNVLKNLSVFATNLLKK